MKECTQHDFNSGFVSALAKFYGHSGELLGSNPSYHLAMTAAKDHLYDMEVPIFIKPSIKKKIKKLNKLAFSVGYSQSDKENKIMVKEAFELCNEILMNIDKYCFKLKHVCTNND